jgi:hypothetical protein
MATQIRRLTVVIMVAALAAWASLEEMTGDWVMVPTQH